MNFTERWLGTSIEVTGNNWEVTGNMNRERKEQVLGTILVITTRRFYSLWQWTAATTAYVRSEPSYFVSRGKLSLNFIGIKMLKTEDRKYYNCQILQIYPSTLNATLWAIRDIFGGKFYGTSWRKVWGR